MCIDTGSGTSVIDASIVPYEYGIIQKCLSVTIKGICGKQITDRCVTTRVIMKAGSSEVEVPVQAYIVAGLPSGLILNMNFLKAQNVTLQLGKQIMTLSHGNGPIITIPLTYSGGSEANIGSMHMTVTRPAFVLAELRRAKWAVLDTTKRMGSHAPPGQNTRAVSKTPPDRHSETYLSACSKSDSKFDCKSITFTSTPPSTFACQHCKHVASFRIKHKMHLRRCFKQSKQPHSPHRRPELDRPWRNLT